MNENNGSSDDDDINEGIVGFGVTQGKAGTFTITMAADESAS